MNVLNLVYPAVMAVFGLVLLFNPRWFRALNRRDYEQRLAERTERGSDAYFEELRGLRAYPPTRSVRAKQALGGVLFLLSAFLIVDQLFISH